MFVWLAADLDDQLAGLRAAAGRIGLPNPALTLPLHVSLRISFPVDPALLGRVCDRVGTYFNTLMPFDICPQLIERQGAVVWLKMAESDILARIHSDLVALLRDEFAVPVHPFDEAFLFHASLFIGERAEEAVSALQDETYPAVLHISKMLIGISETGSAGEYRVWREVPLIPPHTPSVRRP